jgi:NAD-dependent deacetylase
VWFEEALPEKEMLLARQASAACDIFFAIGTSAMVQPAASLPLEALYRGATVVEINPQRTSLTCRAQFALHRAAGAVLPELLQRLRK